jgi:dUTP pyrophosphatase
MTTFSTIKPVKLKLNSVLSKQPQYQTKGAAGMDITSTKSLVIHSGDRALVPTGLSFEIPVDYEIQVRPRSGLALKQGITVLNSPGTIDSDYRGELGVILMNSGKDDFNIEVGDRIAQIVLCPVVKIEFEIVEDLSVSDRGAGGFGSTGQ